MGDFDKKDATSSADAAAKEKKKMIMVGVLGAALVAVVLYQFNKSGPQVAKGFGAPEAQQLAASPELTPIQALAGLDPSKDPTARLLLGSPELPREFVSPPRNPFKLSDDMRTQLIKVVEVKAEPAKVVHVPQVRVTQPRAPLANIAGLKLQGIFQRGDKFHAIINGSIVTVNAVIGKVRIVDIRQGQVLVRHADWPGGPVSALSMK
jgi:hypothetical protein